MLITRFNRMIRNKVLWGFFAFAVCVMFIGVYSNTGGCGYNDTAAPDAAGSLFGKSVSLQELRRAEYYTAQMNNTAGLTPEQAQKLTAMAWKRLAALRTAEQYGISVSAEEVAEVIRRDPAFADTTSGVFSPERYRRTIEALKQIPVQEYEQFVHEEIMLHKLLAVLDAAVWTSPFEARERLSKLTDVFSIQYASFGTNDYAAPVTISEDEARRYFETNKERFKIPDQVSVQFVVFPASNFLDQVQVTDAEVNRYYTNNLEKFTVSEGTNTPYAKPLEKVRDEILSSLKQSKALDLATEKAGRFVELLLPDKKDKSIPLSEAAGKNALNVSTTALFSIREPLTNLNVGLDFNVNAFGLDAADPYRRVSDPVAGKDAVYVMAPLEKKEAHLPEFQDVADKVRQRAAAEAWYDAFIKKGNEIRDSLNKSLGAGKTFTAALKDFKANVSTTLTFTVYEALSDPQENYDVIVPKITTLNKGELTEPLETDSGLIIAYVADRTPGNPVTEEGVRSELLSMLDRSMAQILFEDWKDYLLAKGRMKDNLAPDKAPDSGDASDL